MMNESLARQDLEPRTLSPRPGRSKPTERRTVRGQVSVEIGGAVPTMQLTFQEIWQSVAAEVCIRLARHMIWQKVGCA